MKDLLFKNLGLKIFSLLFSMVLWFYITTEKESELGFLVKLSVRNIPKDMELVGKGVDRVTVWVYGLRRYLMRISPDEIVVPVDLKNAKEGVIIYPINLEVIKVPHEVSVTRVSPSTIRFQLERVIGKKVKVVPELKGKLAIGYDIESMDEQPDFVNVKGKRSIIENLNTVYTYPIDINGLSQNLKFEVPIDEERSKIKVEEGEKMVMVDIKVKERIIEKTFTEVPVSVEDLDQSTIAVITPDKATLKLKGPEAVLVNLNKDENIKVVLDIKKLNSNKTVRRKAKVILPDKIILLKLEPEWFKIHVEEEE